MNSDLSWRIRARRGLERRARKLPARLATRVPPFSQSHDCSTIRPRHAATVHEPRAAPRARDDLAVAPTRPSHVGRQRSAQDVLTGRLRAQQRRSVDPAPAVDGQTRPLCFSRSRPADCLRCRSEQRPGTAEDTNSPTTRGGQQRSRLDTSDPPFPLVTLIELGRSGGSQAEYAGSIPVIRSTNESPGQPSGWAGGHRPVSCSRID